MKDRKSEAARENELLAKIIRSKENWQSTIDAVKDHIFVLDRSHTLRNANASFADRFGKHPRELIGLKLTELPCSEIPLPEILDAEPDNASISREIVVDGNVYEMSVSTACYEEEQVFVYVIRNITELIELKNRLFHTSKLTSLGRLVSGVAHELNNPMTGILGYAEILSLRVQDEGVRKDLAKISRSAERCKVIIDSLLSFSRQQATQKNLEYINNIIDRIVDLRAYWHRTQKIEVLRELEEDMPLCHFDIQQIQQVILNILMNAEQAVQGSGKDRKIVIRTWHDKAQQKIMLSIGDNGVGIPKENLTKIFDPFFTTKPLNIGTGLGLSISYGIVLEHDGIIHVESNEGEGSVFTVQIPIT